MSLRKRTRRGFSILEMLIALGVVSVVLTGAMVALDAAFRGYEATTNSASTHSVTRLVMHRMVAMVRTGTEFGPFPEDVLDLAQNPLVTDEIEFVSFEDEATGRLDITRIDRRDGAEGELPSLWITVSRFRDGAADGTPIERPLLRNVQDAVFTLEYDVGPRLRRATIDLSVFPNDDLDATRMTDAREAIPIRMVASVVPRRLQD